MAAEVAFEEAKNRIVQGAEWLHRLLGDVQGRYDRAVDAGEVLAAEVSRFLGSPADVGNDALYVAYKRYMELSAGNFSPPGAGGGRSGE